jgi:hypothetical protein
VIHNLRERWASLVAEARQRYQVEPCLGAPEGAPQGTCVQERCPDCVSPDWPTNAVPTWLCTACERVHCSGCTQCARLAAEADSVSLIEIDRMEDRLRTSHEQVVPFASDPSAYSRADLQRMADVAFWALGGGEDGLESATDHPELMAAVERDDGRTWSELASALESIDAELRRLERLPIHLSGGLRRRVEDVLDYQLWDKICDLHNAVYRRQDPDLLRRLAGVTTRFHTLARRLQDLVHPSARRSRRLTELRNPRALQRVRRAQQRVLGSQHLLSVQRPAIPGSIRRRAQWARAQGRGSRVRGASGPLTGLHRRGARQRRGARRGARTSARSRGDGHACAPSGRSAPLGSLPA